MAIVKADYKKLKSKADKMHSLIYESGGMLPIFNQIYQTQEKLSKAWVDEEHYEHLNVLVKMYNEIRNCIGVLDTYKKLLYDAGSEYEKAVKDSTTVAKN